MFFSPAVLAPSVPFCLQELSARSQASRLARAPEGIMRLNARLILPPICSSFRRGRKGRPGSRRPRRNGAARGTGSGLTTEEQDRSCLFAARKDLRDAAARPLTTAASAAGPGIACGGGGDGQQRKEGEWFRISETVKLALHRGDITGWAVDGKTDAIVNAANSRMLGGGGVDGAIHRKAGPELREACLQVPEVNRGVRCPVGEARITPGFDLPVSRVIHTVGPIYRENNNSADLLGNAYRNSLKVALENGIKFICFPAVSCGVYSYPVREAAAISLSVIKEASNGLSEVHFVLFEQETYVGWMKEASKQFTEI